MKILLTGYNFAPEPTGIGRYSGELAHWFASRGHEVRVVTSFPYYPWWRVQASYGRRVFMTERVTKNLVVDRAWMYVPRNQSGARRVLQEASFVATSLVPLARAFAWKPDVCLAVCPPIMSQFGTLAVARLSRAPFWVHVQDLQVDAAIELGLLPPVVRRVLASLELALYSAAARVTTISAGMDRRIGVKGNGHIRRGAIVPNWSSVTAPSADEIATWRYQNGFAPADRIVLYAGNLGQKQGLEAIPALARELLASEPDVQLVIAGDGAMRPKLAELAGGLTNVRFLPLQPESALPAMLGAAELHLVLQKRGAADLVLPSKLTNILAVGGVAVITCEPGTSLHDFVADTGAAVAVPPEDQYGLAAAVQQLLADSEVRAKISSRATRYAAESLDRDAILGRLEAVMLEVMHHGGARGAKREGRAV